MTHWFSPAPPRVIAHRGLATTAPENTLLAFVEALAIGVTHLETDVHGSRDGVAVISHDPDLGRLTGVATRILDSSVSELRRIPLGNDQTVPTLAEALDAFPDARFNIDVKDDAAAGPAIEAIRRTRSTERVLVTSFDEARRRQVVAALPGVATSPSTRGVLAAAVVGGLHLRPFAGRVLRSVNALQIPERHRGVPILTPGLIAAAHRHGVEVHVWTVNDPADMSRLLTLGVDGLITDRADLAVPLVSERSASR